MLLLGIAHGGHSGERGGSSLRSGGDLQLISRSGHLALDGFAGRQYDAQFGVAVYALHGGPGHGDFAHKLALDGELVPVLFNDGAADGVTVGEHYLVGGQGGEGEQ
jgi:hypothetical protein